MWELGALASKAEHVICTWMLLMPSPGMGPLCGSTMRHSQSRCAECWITDVAMHAHA